MQTIKHLGSGSSFPCTGRAKPEGGHRWASQSPVVSVVSIRDVCVCVCVCFFEKEKETEMQYVESVCRCVNLLKTKLFQLSPSNSCFFTQRT